MRGETTESFLRHRAWGPAAILHVAAQTSGKKLARLSKFIRFDAPHHDDWNDLFNDLAKLEDNLVLGDGPKLSLSNLAGKFAVLHTVDWLEPSRESKTPRELHSMGSLCVNA